MYLQQRFINSYLKIYKLIKVHPLQYLSNLELIQLLKQRDKNVFNYLYDTYAPSLYGVILKLVKNNELADEILEKVFIEIWNTCTTFDCTKQSLFICMYSITYKMAKAELTNTTHTEVSAVDLVA